MLACGVRNQNWGIRSDQGLIAPFGFLAEGGGQLYRGAGEVMRKGRWREWGVLASHVFSSHAILRAYL